ASVYEAYLQDEARERRALKLLHAPGGGERFLREARLSLQLRHPNLVAFYDCGEHEGRAYLVMEKVEGCTLDQAGLSLAGRLDCLGQICQALQALHDLGIVHRDLKPANIMVSGSKALLMDFGIARSLEEQQLTLPGQAVGTPGYMAPEQILGHEPAATADLYSLGVVLYECCSGKLPYQAETSFELLTKQLEQEPAPLQGPPAELCELTMALLSRDPGSRPGPPARLATQLREWSQRLQAL
ncbi:MAG: serine/threonine protein kinase, partial [Candidatus Eremiobacteraeota bacterium]|nr:serine/threonine protein kinase [Candidatus Eremiobacteraeota bacterium]